MQKCRDNSELQGKVCYLQVKNAKENQKGGEKGRSKYSRCLEDRSCVNFGYIFTEKLAQVTTA